MLTFVKTVAAPQDDSGYSEELNNELDSRYAEYLAGVELLTQEDIDRETEKIINGKGKK